MVASTSSTVGVWDVFTSSAGPFIPVSDHVASYPSKQFELLPAAVQSRLDQLTTSAAMRAMLVPRVECMTVVYDC